MDSHATEVISTARRMNALGINSGASGNVSVRVPGGMLITPSSVAYDELTEADIVRMRADGAWEGAEGRRPSSEWRFHLDIYAARDDVEAIVHAHPVSATGLAVHGRGIPPFHYMVAVAGGHDIRCCGYATFGTQALSAEVVSALDDRRACLMAHHGMIATGSDLGAALALAVEVETLAAQYLAALQLGDPPLLSGDEMDAVLVKMRSGAGYGSV